MEQEQVITRQEALLQNLPFYFTGKPCGRGHLSKRRTKKSNCVECEKIVQGSYYRQHKDACRQRNDNWKLKNPDRHFQNQRRWRQEHRTEQKEYHQQWRNENREHYTSHQAEWIRKNPDKRAQTLKRYNNKPLIKIAGRLRARLRMAIIGQCKKGSSVRDLGCSIEQFQAYLSKKFSSEMSWENWGTVWELDHIRPLMSFNLSDRVQFQDACHYTNLQPLLIEYHKQKTIRERRARI